jgi:hypothetical protein
MEQNQNSFVINDFYGIPTLALKKKRHLAGFRDGGNAL